jgi:hypothetical protein
MKRIFFILIFLFHFYLVNAQFAVPKTWVAGVGTGFFRNSSSPRDINNTPFLLDLKFGRFLTKILSVNLDFQSLNYKEFKSGPGSLQPPGGSYDEMGVLKDIYTAMGISVDYYQKLAKRFFLVPDIYVHYLHNKNEETGQYYSNGSPIGILFKRNTYYGYYGQAGAKLSLGFTINSAFSMRVQLAEFEIRVRKYGNDIIWSNPILAGIQYQFK